jgi:hypothetical protein
LVVFAAVLVLVALVVFVLPLTRSGSASAAPRPAGPGAPAARPSSPTGPIVRGFGYLYMSPRPEARRGGVHARLARAFARVDSVDPHAATRRIGEALLDVGAAEPAARPAPQPPPDLGWGNPTVEQPKDVE